MTLHEDGPLEPSAGTLDTGARNEDVRQVVEAAGEKGRGEQGPPETLDEPHPMHADDGMPREIGGPKGAEPTRFGDWERNGRCSDF